MEMFTGAFALAAALALPPAPPLEDLVAEALSSSPALAALESAVAGRLALEAPAGALPDPMLETMLQNAGFGPTVGEEEMSMVGLEASQRLPYPGKRAAARAVAKAETAMVAADLELLRRRIRAEVSTLYARLYALDRESESLSAAAEMVDLLTEIARSRYATGQGDQEGVLKTQLQALRVAEQRADVESERQSRVAELNRWLNRPGGITLPPIRALPQTPPIEDDAQNLAVEQAAEIRRARAALALAERGVELARLELKPNFEASAGLNSRGGLDPVITARFGVELPLWRRQKQLPMLSASESELQAARDELADAEAMVRAEARVLREAWANADRQITRYRDGILLQAGATLDAARASYLAGRGDFSTVIEDFNLWLEASVGLARREADRFAARAGFERLLGLKENS